MMNVSIVLSFILVACISPCVGFRITSPASLAAIIPNGGIPDLQPSLIGGMPVAPEIPVKTSAVFQSPFIPESCTALNNPDEVEGKIFFMMGLPGTGTPSCSSKQKILLAESLGAVAVVVIYIVPDIFGLSMYTFPDMFMENKIPSYMMHFEQGLMVKSFADKGIPVEIDLFQAKVPDTELANLRDFYNQANGPSWQYIIPGIMEGTWHMFQKGDALPEGNDPARSKWPFVSFTPDGYLSQTGFLATPMGTPFPPAILKMTRVRFLSLGGAGFTGDFPDFSPLVNAFLISVKGSFLAGSIPESMSALTELVTLNVAGNRLSGNVPASLLSSWKKITSIDLSSSSLSGTLPPFSEWGTRLTSLNLNGNKFSGSIPSDISEAAVKLVTLDVTSNNLSGDIPDLSGLKALTTLRLRGNKLTGPLPQSLQHVTKLTAIDFAYNELSGEIAVDLTPLTEVTQVFLQGNRFTGAVPSKLPLKTTFLDLSNNELTAMSDLKMYTSLKRFNIANNRIAGDLNVYVTRMLPPSSVATSGLEEIDISGNLFDSKLTDPFVSFFEGPFVSLRVYRAKSNPNLRGRLLVSGSATTYPNLEEMNFADNPGISGWIPVEVSQFPTLRVFDITNTSMAHVPPAADPDSLVPSFITPSFALAAFDSTKNRWCPRLIGNLGNNAVYETDPEYHRGLLCKCDKDYRNVGNATCVRCPELTTICPGFENDTVMVLRPGYYPSPPENPVHAVRCYDDALSGTSCNPDGDDVFRCKAGFEGRLCSKCVENHFERNRRCERCNPLGALIISGAAMAILAVLVFVLWKVGAIGQSKLAKSIEKDKFNWFFDSHGDKVNMKHAIGTVLEDEKPPPDFVPRTAVSFLTIFTIFINYLQTTSIALDGLQLGSELGVIKSIYELASLSLGEMGFECLSSGLSFERRYVITWVFPLVLIAVVWVLACLVSAIRRFTGSEQNSVFLYASGLCLLVVNFAYFPYAKSSLSKYRCEMDPGLNEEYLAEAPYVKCDAIPPSGKLIPVLIYVVFGMILLGGFSLVGGFGHKLLHDKYFRMFGWYYTGFKPKYWFFPLLLTQRKLLLALVTGLAEKQDVFRYTSVIGILAGAMLVTIYFHPYKYAYANRLDSFATFAGLIIYGNSMIISNPDLNGNESILIAVTFAAHVLSLLVFAGAFINWFIYKIRRAKEKKNALVTKVLPVTSKSPTKDLEMMETTKIEVSSNNDNDNEESNNGRDAAPPPPMKPKPAPPPKPAKEVV